MAQPPRRVKSATESRRRNMESSTNGNSINGTASGRATTSPYSQSISSVSKGGHGSSEITRRVSQKDKPAIPAKPPLNRVPPPKHNGKSNGTSPTATTLNSKTQTSAASSEKREGENRVNGGSQVRKTSDINGEARPSSGKSRYCLEITLEKKVSTPTVRRKQAEREAANSIASSSEESSPSQSPSKSVHFKSSRSNSASSIDSRDRLRFGGIPGSLPRYQCHTISSADKIQRTKSASGKAGTGMEAHSETQLNGSSNGTSVVEPIRRGRARSVGPIRRVRSNEMMPPKRDLSPSPKSGKISQVRSKSVERSKNRQSFGGFVQRQRQAWEERVTTVTKRAPLSNLAEKNVNRRSLDPNHAPKIMQKSGSVTQRKNMLFGKGANIQKVKSTIDGNQVNKPTSPTSIQNKSDASQQVPKTKSSSNDCDFHTSTKAEMNGQVGSKAYAQGDNVASSDQKRTSILDNPPDKPSVLQEIAPAPSSKPNAPNSLPVKPVYQNADLSHRVSRAKENNIGMLVTDLDALDVNGTDEIDNGKSHLFIDEETLGIKPECLRLKPQTSDTQGEYSEILGLADPKEINKLNSETLHNLKKMDNTFLEVEKKKDTVVDKAKEQEKAGICNGEDVGEKDGHYFLKVVNEEQSRIESLCRKVEHDLESDMSDEAGGICRAFLGKANLLTSKKFKQFRGLCEQNITPSEEAGKSTLASDLAGFWDMVMIQVDDINSKFIDIETLKDNNWKVTAPEVTKVRGSF
nr:serine/arginine repetitive matrix protein 1-like [Lytechinus pictus]XP_054751952.1 serine/arginine repetitive matrix protein 1-like [Lytechinus pictus]